MNIFNHFLIIIDILYNAKTINKNEYKRANFWAPLSLISSKTSASKISSKVTSDFESRSSKVLGVKLLSPYYLNTT